MTPAEILYPYALTTLQRVKDMLSINTPGNDQVLSRLINSATDFIEAECNGRRFVLTKYVNDVQSTQSNQQQSIVLRQSPVFYMVFTGNTTAGSNVITNFAAVPVYGSVAGTSIGSIQVGMPIQWGDNGQGAGTGQLAIPQGIQTFVTAVNSTAGTITMSNPAIVTLTGANFLVHGLINAQYRAGVPTAPSWTDYIPDQFELVNNGQSGIIRIYGVIPRIYNNMFRATYWAGYVVDFDNFGNQSYHTLPADLTYTCEKLVIRMFNRRDFAGKTSQSLSGSTISYKDQLDADDKMVLAHYRRVNTAM